MGYSPWGRKESDTTEETEHTAWEKQQITYEGSPIRPAADFLKDKRESHDTLDERGKPTTEEEFEQGTSSYITRRRPTQQT